MKNVRREIEDGAEQICENGGQHDHTDHGEGHRAEEVEALLKFRADPELISDDAVNGTENRENEYYDRENIHVTPEAEALQILFS